MTAPILRTRVRTDILIKADRILRELGYPEPPLRLEDVRELLKLDRSFFSGESDGLLKTVCSRLKRAGKQLLLRPALLGDAIKKFDLRAVYLPDHKRILIDDRGRGTNSHPDRPAVAERVGPRRSGIRASGTRPK